MLDPFAMVRIRKFELHIWNLHGRTVLLIINLLILVTFCCSSIFWIFCIFVAQEHVKYVVWSSKLPCLVWMLFGAWTGQSGSATACFQNAVVLASGISITKMPLAYLIYIISISFFHFYFIWLHDLTKFISHSFCIQILWNFLHCSHDDV